MPTPLFYTVESRLYPRLILGSDRFLRLFPKLRPPEMFEESYIFNLMSEAYKLGVGGFDVNIMSEDLLGAFSRLKKVYGNDVVGIGNPSWKCGYMLKNQHLMDIKPRVIRTLVEYYMDGHSRSLVAMLPEKNRRFFFHVDLQVQRLSETEIEEIFIDEDLWIGRLKRLQGLVDYCLVGSDYADWMILLGRKDLLHWQIKTIREHDMIPIGICHWTSITLPILNTLPVAAHWSMANLEVMYLSTLEAISAIRSINKPITCFRALRGILIPDEIEKAFRWLCSEARAQSIVAGVDNQQQAQETFSIAYDIVKRYTQNS